MYANKSKQKKGKMEGKFWDMTMIKGEKKATTAPGQWLLTTFNNKKGYIPNLNSKVGRIYGIWNKPVRQAYWYWEY